jgi:hypothetical protein
MEESMDGDWGRASVKIPGSCQVLLPGKDGSRLEGENVAKGSGFVGDGAGFEEPCGGDGGGAEETELAMNEDGALAVMEADKIEGEPAGGGVGGDEIEEGEAEIGGALAEQGTGVGFRSEVEDGDGTGGEEGPGFGLGEAASEVDAGRDLKRRRQAAQMVSVDEA